MVIYNIDAMNIRNVDLNLFIVLEALMQERNVTRAARRLRLSQPAVSAALKRLRHALADPLLVRTRGGMRPTLRAEQIYSSVKQSLDTIQGAVQSNGAFAPDSAQRSFNVMMSDIGEMVFLPRLIERLRRDAPSVRLFVRRLARPRVHEELASGAVDLAIGWMDHAGGLQRQSLFWQEFVCIVRRKHPRIRQRLTASQFISEWHLVVGRHDPDTQFQPSEYGVLDQRTIRQRNVAMTVPHFLAVPNIIASTDLLCVVPRQLAQVYADYGWVRIVALPSKSKPFEVAQFWHKRSDGDQGNAWLRGVISNLLTAPRG
jgi:DNA-binding transcriptional LysR family regulator